MAWVKLDDGFASHPKIVGLSDAAFRAHVAGLCHCGRYLTDGLIATKAVPSIAKPKVRRELVEAGLWRETAAGFEVVNFTEYNPTKEKVQADRKKTAERVRNWRERNGDSNGVTTNAGNGVSNAVTYEGCNGVSNGAPDPTRPDPKKSQPDVPSRETQPDETKTMRVECECGASLVVERITGGNRDGWHAADCECGKAWAWPPLPAAA